MARRVIIAGGTGFIGSAIARALVDRGDEVTVLTRDPFKEDTGLPSSVTLKTWDPRGLGDWIEHVDGQDAVMNFTGETVVGRRYTEALKQRMRDSRVGTTERLVQAMERAKTRPKTFVCASAIGYYGHDHGLEPLDEAADAGHDFLGALCVDWENAAKHAELLGVRVVNTRFGIVLAKDGGFLGTMVLPFKFFLGAVIADGGQVVSWVHVDDAVAMTLRCLDDETLHGPVNVTAPNAATNAELTHAIGHALGRPAWLKVPAFALQLAFGEGADPILGGQRVVPRRMREMGYAWRYSNVRTAVRAALE